MRLLFVHASRHKRTLAAAFALATVNLVLQLADPQIFRIVIDRYALRTGVLPPAAFVRGVSLLIAASVGLALIARVARNMQEYLINLVARRVGSSVYTSSLTHSLLLPFSTFEDLRSGELLQKVTKAKSEAELTITYAVRLYASTLGIAAVTAYAFTLDWILGVLLLLLSPLLALLLTTISHPIRREQRAITDETARLAGAATETLRNVELVKSHGLEERAIGRIHDAAERILELEARKLRLVRRFGFSEGTANNLARAAVILTMLLLVYNGRITLGQFLSLFLYTQTIFAPLTELATMLVRYQEASATFETLDGVMQLRREERGREAALGPIAEIDFDDVSLQYPYSAAPALASIDLTFRAGETVALVGPSGSGKSSLVKLLIGLYAPSAGRIRFNGIDRAAVDTDDLRQRIGVVTHDTHLFAGTVAENVRAVRPEASDQECLEALTRAAALPILERGGEGLETRIGEGGLKLSGGERQRIAIARALLRNPEVLVFDEATSNLDSATEQAIASTMREVARVARITVIVAHRLSTVAHADRIVVLARGRIVESGTHAALLARGGVYAAMWREQAA